MSGIIKSQLADSLDAMGRISMRKTEIATKVFEAMDAVPPVDIIGGELVVPIADLAGLALVPWFCDESVQWALRLSMPGRALKKTLLKKVNDSFIAATEEGAVLIGVPGDGIEPSTYTLFPLVEAVAQVVEPGMMLELAAANLGVVKRDLRVGSGLLSPLVGVWSLSVGRAGADEAYAAGAGGRGARRGRSGSRRPPLAGSSTARSAPGIFSDHSWPATCPASPLARSAP
jgi:hypothetical protein